MVEVEAVAKGTACYARSPQSTPCCLTGIRARPLCSVMHISKAFVIAAAFVVTAGCHLLDVSTPTSSGGCPVSAVINAGISFSDYKQRIPRQAAVAPPDSVVDVLLV